MLWNFLLAAHLISPFTYVRPEGLLQTISWDYVISATALSPLADWKKTYTGTSKTVIAKSPVLISKCTIICTSVPHGCIFSPSLPQHLHHLTSSELDGSMGSPVRVLMLLLVNNHEKTTKVIYLLWADILNCFVLADLPKFAPPRNSAGIPSSTLLKIRRIQ